jgi:hypothetical protein
MKKYLTRTYMDCKLQIIKKIADDSIFCFYIQVLPFYIKKMTLCDMVYFIPAKFYIKDEIIQSKNASK